MKIAIIGFGARGALYSNIFMRHAGIEIAAVCDSRRERLDYAKRLFHISESRLYTEDFRFFSEGKTADLCIVSTQDGQHHAHAVAALTAGYDILLEKPIAVSEQDCLDLYGTAKKLGRKVFVCHVLRYAPLFYTIKNELKSGLYGRVSTINLTENVAYWHQAHSYVRGNWANSAGSSPMIIAKCCHDLDLISWFTEADCKRVSSMGGLSFYTRKNAPAESADRCTDCKYCDTCEYSAKVLYLTKKTDAELSDWPCNTLATEPTREKLLDAIKTGPYGRCVYKCGNDAPDHQVVNMEFEGGATAHLTMTAFSDKCYRQIHVHCERGEIYGDTIGSALTCHVFGKTSKILDLNNPDTTDYGHGGGDALLIDDIIRTTQGNPAAALTSIEHSLQSHFIGFAAEKSRQNGGVPIPPAG
jgi:predicted dehydrogenase